jgi:hypothetical protein
MTTPGCRYHRLVGRQRITRGILGLLGIAGIMAACASPALRQLEDLARLSTPTSGASAISLTPLETRDGTLYAISLRKAEDEVRRTLENQQRPAAPLLFGGLTDIVGYRWDADKKDLLLIGKVGTGPKLMLDQFVTALRLGQQDFVGMSLVPADPTDLDSDHRVVVFPPEAEDTILLAPAIVLDHRLKGQAMSQVGDHYRRELRECSGSRPAALGTLAFLVLVPAKPELAYDKTPNGFTVWVRKADILLRPSRSLQADPAASQAEDSALDEFATDATRRLEMLKEGDPVVKQVHSLFVLVLLSQLLRAEQLPFDFGYWLSESGYPATPFPTPRMLPGFRAQRITATCWGRPYAETEYGGVTTERRVWGGVVLAYKQYLAEFRPDLAARLQVSGAQPLGEGGWSMSTVTSMTSNVFPPTTLPEIWLPPAAIQQLLSPATSAMWSPGMTSTGIPTLPGQPAIRSPVCTTTTGGPFGSLQTICY